MKTVLFIHIASCLIQISYLLIFTFLVRRVKTQENDKKSIDGKQISIVVCARNELQNLKSNIYYWLNQKSNQNVCELVIVDDASTDGSNEFLRSIEQQFENVKLVTIKEKTIGSGKKVAVNKGVMAATGKYILLTDADCIPNSELWAELMTKPLKSVNKKIVLGFAPYHHEPTLVNSCVQYETALTAMLFSGFTLAGMPYMGLGRNMLYEKSFYVAVGGHNNHPEELNSGDDDIFINQNANKENTTLCFNKSSFCYSAAPNTFKEWYNQKLRHVSTSPYYKTKHIFLLFIYSISHFLYIGTIFVVIFTASEAYLLLFFLIRAFLLLNLFKKFSNISNLYLIRLVTINDIIHIFYYFTLIFYSFIVQKNTWK